MEAPTRNKAAFDRLPTAKTRSSSAVTHKDYEKHVDMIHGSSTTLRKKRS